MNEIKSVIEMEESNIKYLEQALYNISKRKEEIQGKMGGKQRLLDSINNFDSEDVQYTSIKKEFVGINEKKGKLITNFRKSIELLNSISSRDILLLRITGENTSSEGVLKLAALLFKENEAWGELERVFLNNTSLLSRLKIY